MPSRSASPLLALCAAATAEPAHAVFAALAAEGGAPAIVQIFPAGPKITANDGRAWTLADPAAIIARFQQSGLPLPIDYEHGQDLLAKKGEKAPAAGWMESLFVRDDGALCANVVWTANGGASVASREYRFISPAFNVSKTNDVVELMGAALVNRPALAMPALARQSTTEPSMKTLAILLGLAETADEAAIGAAIKTLQGERTTALARAETPDLAKFVPRADYDAVLARATGAEGKIVEAAKATLEADITREIDAAMKAGKIAPATKDYYLAMCRKDGGLDEFKKFVALATSAFTPSGLDNKDPNAGDKTALTREQKDVCAQLGISEERMLKQVVEDAAKRAA